MSAFISACSIHVDVPVKPIKLSVVNLCAKSATTLPLLTTLSNVLSCANFDLRAASRNRATFCCGVSLGGAGPPIGIVVPRGGIGFAEAWGPVWVNNVGSLVDIVCAVRGVGVANERRDSSASWEVRVNVSCGRGCGGEPLDDPDELDVFQV
jgi:hypothetical protein